jgi:DUF1365 family protein
MLMPSGPALYRGTVRHRRLSPTPHEFCYDVFMALLDIDRIPEAMRVSPFTSYNRWNWASFHEADHFGDPRVKLRERLEREARRDGVVLPDGPIYLLTNLRTLGYTFNPVSFFYCYDRAGRLPVVLAEVNNTFGETCNYWLRADGDQALAEVRQHASRKVFHVSPFLSLDQEYAWVLKPPGDRVAVHIGVSRAGEQALAATLSLSRRPWTRAAIHEALVAHPWMCAKIIAAIHWQALRLYLKRVPFHPHPGTPPSLGRPRRWRREEPAR